MDPIQFFAAAIGGIICGTLGSLVVIWLMDNGYL